MMKKGLFGKEFRNTGNSDSNRVVIKSQHYYYDINQIYEAEINGQTVIVIDEGSQIRED